MPCFAALQQTALQQAALMNKNEISTKFLVVLLVAAKATVRIMGHPTSPRREPMWMLEPASCIRRVGQNDEKR